MLSFGTPTIYQSPKCFVSYSKTGHVDPKQVPKKGKPWTAFSSLEFVNRVDLLVPGECFDILHRGLVEERPPPMFSRVILRLGDMLDGSFFTDYIKKGEILMLSEGRTTVDRVFALRDGTLTMHLDKEAYERAGLVGKPYGAKGRRSGKPRWVVTYDLHNPSMLHGKKAFDRLLYACKNVFHEPMTWLFCNLASTPPDPDPLGKHAPTDISSSPTMSRDVQTSIPSLAIPSSLSDTLDRTLLEEFATDVYEWLSLIRLQSPRVCTGDNVDPYISGYTTPAGDSLASSSGLKMDIDMGAGVKASTGPVAKISWEGLLSPAWIRDMLAQAMATVPSSKWFSLSATTFAKGFAGDVGEVAILRPQGARDEFVLWEIKSEE